MNSLPSDSPDWPGQPEPTMPIPPYPYSQPTPYSEPGGYVQPTAFGQPTPHGQPVPYDAQQLVYAGGPYAAQKSRVAAGLLAIFLGGLGIHNFYLGRVGMGLTQLLISILSLGILAPLIWVWSLVEGILILTRSPSFSTDKRGIPLSD